MHYYSACICLLLLWACGQKKTTSPAEPETLRLEFLNEHFYPEKPNRANEQCMGFDAGILAMIPYFKGSHHAEVLNGLLFSKIIPVKYLSGNNNDPAEQLKKSCRLFLEDSLNRLPAFVTLGVENIIYQDSSLIGLEMIHIVEPCAGILPRMDTWYIWLSLSRAEEIHAGNVGEMPLHAFLEKNPETGSEDADRFKKLLNEPGLFNKAGFSLVHEGLVFHLNANESPDYKSFTGLIPAQLADEFLRPDFPRPW